MRAGFVCTGPLLTLAAKGSARSEQCAGRAPYVRACARNVAKVDCPEKFEKPEKPEKRAKRMVKAREVLLRLVPHAGDFPTAAEFNEALESALVEAGIEGGEAAYVNARAARKMEKLARKQNGRIETTEGLRLGVPEVCTGKACVKRAGAFALLEGAASKGLAAVPCSCLGKCKESGVTVRIDDALYLVKDVDELTDVLTENRGGGRNSTGNSIGVVSVPDIAVDEMDKIKVAALKYQAVATSALQ
jgi:hypothetical protein